MIIVTGSSGLLGSAVKRQLENLDHEFVCASHDLVDLTDAAATDSFFAAQRPDVVIHMAARVHGLMGNKRFPAEVYDNNIRINTNVISASRKAGARKIVAASTVAAYPGHLVHNIAELQFLDGPPHAGESAYAHSKRAMLGQLEAYRTQYGIDFVYGILTNLYGPHDRFDIENGHVIPSLVAKFHAAAQSGTAVHVWGRGRARRDFLYVEDAAAALIHLTGTGSGMINIATGQTLPITRIVEILSELSGVRDIVWEEDKPEGQLDRSYDVSLLRETGFTSEHSLEQGLRETYEWYARNYSNVRR